MRFTDRLAGERLPDPSPLVPPDSRERVTGPKPTRRREPPPRHGTHRVLRAVEQAMAEYTGPPNPRALRDLIDGCRSARIDMDRRDALVRLAAWALASADQIDQRIDRSLALRRGSLTE
jgi:hypothetical protein